MAMSQEYPDLPFVPPRAFGRGRDGHTVQYLVIHYTAGAERSTSAEDGAAYDQRRTDGVSTHYFVDSNSVVQCVYTWDRGNAAWTYGNRKGIQYELCGTVQSRAQWLDPASDATLTNAARQAARDCRKYGLPVRRLTVAQMKAGEKGICGHVDVTNAYGLGNHTDPGPAFPWDVFLARVQQFVSGGSEGGEEEMDPKLAGVLWNLGWMMQNGVIGQQDPVVIPPGPAGVEAAGASLPNKFKQALDAAKEAGVTVDVTTLTAALADPTVAAAFAAAVQPVVDAELDEAFSGGADQD